MDKSRAAKGKSGVTAKKAAADPLLVQSVEKAFRVLAAFDDERPTMSLTQLASTIGMDISATQRFAHTLTKLGYLSKDVDTKRFELTAKTLDLGYHYTRASKLVARAMPFLLHLSKETEETVNLTVPDGTEIVFVARFMSRHVLSNDVIIGTRLPAFCTAPGVAMLSKMPPDEAREILRRSDLKPYTPSTTYRLQDILKKIDLAGKRGFATAFEEFYHGDLSIAAPILSPKGYPIGAINVGVSRARFTNESAVEQFAPLVVATAMSISQSSRPPR
ncbi:IclR family pca regulon transcriptional regulator [Bradyrhizobium japonicum]|uniref:IclR family transcriptional regulator n=1 Tax=Bradyrhizobium japonicum TaxID=375 RepID=UPI00339786C2